jgi:hypothetical protein
MGITVPADVATHCQEHHNYDCPIFNQILTGSAANDFVAEG